MRRKSLVGFMAMSLLIVGGVIYAPAIFAMGAEISSEPFQIFAVAPNPAIPGPGVVDPALGSFTDIPGTSSKLVRTDNGVSISAHASGLAPGVYTTWWSIDKNGDGVFPDEMVLYAGGGIVGPNGKGHFAAHLPVGEIPPADFVNVVVNAGGNQIFDNPRTATVRFVIRYHGPKVPGLVAQQTHTFLGGCSNNAPIPTTGTFVCFDPQRVTHTP